MKFRFWGVQSACPDHWSVVIEYVASNMWIHIFQISRDKIEWEKVIQNKAKIS